MKLKNNWFFRKNIQNKDLLILGIILLFCLIYRIIYFRTFAAHTLFYNSDSVTYFTSGIDLYRTPFYPCILKLFEGISKDNFVNYLIYFQQILYFLSIVPFFFFLRNTLKNKGVIILMTLLYACIPVLLHQNININPECLCIVGSTFILFLFSQYIKKPQKSLAFCVGFFPLILIMLKPIYLILPCILFVIFIVRFLFYKNEKRILLYGVMGLITAILGILSFCTINKKYNGEFTLSKISLNNSLANIVISGAYQYGEDEELISLVDSTKQQGYYVSVFLLNNEYMDKYRIAYNEKFPKNLVKTGDMEFCMSIPDIDNYPQVRLNMFVKKSQCTKIYFKYIKKRFIEIFLQYQLLFFVMFFELIIMLLSSLKYKKISWMLLFCTLFTIGQFAIITIGGIYDWRRLLLPCYPFIILILSSFIDILWSLKGRIIEIIQDIS